MGKWGFGGHCVSSRLFPANSVAYRTRCVSSLFLRAYQLYLGGETWLHPLMARLVAGGLSSSPWGPLQRAARVSSQHGSWLPPKGVAPESKAEATCLLGPSLRRHSPPFRPCPSAAQSGRQEGPGGRHWGPR